MADTPENAVATLVNPDGSFGENYLDAQIENAETGEKGNLFPDEVRGHPKIRNFKNLSDVYNTVLNQESLIGKDKVAIPGKDAKPEEWDATMKGLGWPEKAEGYNFKPSETDNPKLTEWFLKTAHAGHFLPSQLKFFYDEWNKFAGAAAKQQKDDFNLAIRKGMEDLTSRLGQAFDTKMEGAEALITMGVEGMKDLGFDDDARSAIEEGLLNDIYKDPRYGALFVAISSMISEDRLREGVKRHETVLTPAEATVQARTIREDKNHPYWKENHPEHEAALKKMEQLTRISLGQ